jgi:uncharacterized protein YyaL (SSP411 family)
MASATPDPAFWSGKSVAVTGGAGFLGRPTVALLEDLGADVRTIRSSEHDLRDRAARAIQALAGSVRQAPAAFTRLLRAVDLYYSPATQVVIVGALSDPATRGLIQTANQGYDPYRTVLLADATAPGADALRERVPVLQGKMPVQGHSAAYVCRDRTCGKPAKSPEELCDALSING